MKYWLMRITLGLAGLFAAMVLLVWLLWIPSAQEPPYPLVRSWGEMGKGPGQFHDPTGIAVSEEEVFVSDARNGRIQVFSHQGEYRRRIGEPGDGPGQLGRPMNLTIHGGELYVADYWNDRISVFGLAGDFRRQIGESGSGPGQFNAPGGVAVAPDGSFYVADFYNQRVQQLKADGSFIQQWGTTGNIGIFSGEFNYPTDVALDFTGKLIVTDGYNDRIQMFSPDGEFLRKWGGPLGMNIFGSFNGWFATVTSVAVDPSGNLFVADFYNHRLQKFDAEGLFLTAFGEHGQGPGQFEHVTAVAVAADGTVFATDFGNHRVLVFAPVAEQFVIVRHPEGIGKNEHPYPAQQDSSLTSLLKVCAQSFRPSTMVR